MADGDADEFRTLERYRTDITLREALAMFATKESVTAITTAITTQGIQLSGVVSRAEHEARWNYEDRRYSAIEERNKTLDVRLDNLNEKLEGLTQRLPPKWMYPALTFAIAAATFLFQFLLHTQVPQAH